LLDNRRRLFSHISEREELVARGSRRVTGRLLELVGLRIGGQADVVFVLRSQRQRASASLEREELGGGGIAGSITTATAGEQDHTVLSVIKVEAAVGQRADDDGVAGPVVMLALGNDIKHLVGAAVTRGRLDGNEVLAEIAREGVDEEAFPVRGLDLNVGERTSCSVVPLMGLRNSGWV